MKLLTRDSFKKARTFVMEQGRELERRLLSYYFDDGAPAAILDELASYQNQDGGFGNGLEPDLQMPDSSVITTTIALRILREVKATSNDEIVRYQNAAPSAPAVAGTDVTTPASIPPSTYILHFHVTGLPMEC